MTDVNPSQFVIYQSEDGRTKLDVRTISEHLKNIFASGELAEDSVIRKFRITAADGKSYATNHYNLDVIISVGYRVRGSRITARNA
jgi:hypothetical protein